MNSCAVCGRRCARGASTCGACGAPLLETRALEHLVDARAKAMIAEEKAAAARAEAERIQQEERDEERAKLAERVATLRRALADNESLPHTRVGMWLRYACRGAVLALVFVPVLGLLFVLIGFSWSPVDKSALPSFPASVAILVCFLALVYEVFVRTAHRVAKLGQLPARAEDVLEASLRRNAAIALRGAALALVFPLVLALFYFPTMPSLTGGAVSFVVSVCLFAFVYGVFVGTVRRVTELDERLTLERTLVIAEAAVAAFDAPTEQSNRPYR
jgi:hypothetical protein